MCYMRVYRSDSEEEIISMVSDVDCVHTEGEIESKEMSIRRKQESWQPQSKL